MTTEREPAMAEPAGTDGGTGIGSPGAPSSMPPTPPTRPMPPTPSTPATPATAPSVSAADARRALAMDGSIAESADFRRPMSPADAAMTAGAIGGTTIADPLVPPWPAAPPPAGTADPGPNGGAATRPSRRLMAARGGLRLLQFGFGVALFVLGVWIGTQVFQANQKPSDVAMAGGVSNGTPTPPVVQEFADALERGGSDAVRSSVSTEVFALLTSELQRWSYATVTHVDVLATAQDGPRTATGLILTGQTTDGRTMWINLVVHTDGGKISTLR